MDLRQVELLKNIIVHKPNFSKADLGDIEAQTTVSLFGKETFLSLFAEQATLYD
jgi:hypothetical protein